MNGLYSIISFSAIKSHFVSDKHMKLYFFIYSCNVLYLSLLLNPHTFKEQKELFSFRLDVLHDLHDNPNNQNVTFGLNLQMCPCIVVQGMGKFLSFVVYCCGPVADTPVFYHHQI